MAFGGDIQMDDIMADDELLPFTDSDSETYSSDEEEVGEVSRKESSGFISDEGVVDLVSDEESVSSEDQEEQNTIRPKLTFKQRLDPLVRPKDKKFQKMENYFFSLLRTSGISIDDILQGTFDDHEITLITPQSGPPDLVEWQRRNAHRYYENLETRFKGATDTLAFKLTCLYFGFPVEPLRMGTMPFLLPPDPDPLDAKKPILKADPLGFLNKYNNDEKFIYDKSIVNLRGGGDTRFGARKKKRNADIIMDESLIQGWQPIDLEILAELERKEEEELKKKNKKQMKDKAMQEVLTKGHGMDIDSISEPTAKQDLVDNFKGIDGSSKKTEKGLMDFMGPQSPNLKKTGKFKSPTSNPFIPASQLRIYGWQGAMNTSLNYVDFVAAVDRLLSNWQRVDRSVCVEIWRTSPVQFVQNAFGTLRHSIHNPPSSDQPWKLVQKYFGQGENHGYACFVRAGDEGEATDAKRPGGYQPLSTERGVIRIEHTTTKDVAYMRMPKKLLPAHKPHQFGIEYMLTMQVLFFGDTLHAWVLHQNGYIGAAYGYLDPPGGLWEQVVDLQSEWSPLPTISFKLNPLDRAVIPVIVPGVFTTRKLPELDRKDFRLTNSTRDSTGLSKVYKAVELSLSNVNLKKECNGFEVWCPAADFKYPRVKPAHVTFSGNITNLTSLKEWQRLLGSGVFPEEGFALVVRPVYKTYRLRKSVDDEKADLQLNEYSLAHFKAFVHNRLFEHYSPKDSSQVIVLSVINRESFQAELTIRHNTTENEWEWIRRNIVEPDLIISVEDLGNDWSIFKDSQWGARHATVNNSVPQVNLVTEPWGASTKNPSTPSSDETPDEASETPYSNKVPLDYVFKDTMNTMDEAERMQILRERTFTSVNSIFTNPLKPVMPLHGPPLESIIKTGPSMPGVSIAMMTPTEVLRLQREVHSLRFQLLDRTRECPYADCDRYFTFGDSDGLDKHIREDHNVLRCFLCNKDQHLLPYYNTNQIKEHFASEHVEDILKAYGQAGAKKSVGPERLCDFFYDCGVITTRMTPEQLHEHMKTHDVTPESSEENESDTDVDMSDLEDNQSSSLSSAQKTPNEDPYGSFPPFVASATPSDTSSSDSDLSLSPVAVPSSPAKKPKQRQPLHVEGNTRGQIAAGYKPEPLTPALRKLLKDYVLSPAEIEEGEKTKALLEGRRPNVWDRLAAEADKRQQQAMAAEASTQAPAVTPQKAMSSSEAFGPGSAGKKRKNEMEVETVESLPEPPFGKATKPQTSKPVEAVRATGAKIDLGIKPEVWEEKEPKTAKSAKPVNSSKQEAIPRPASTKSIGKSPAAEKKDVDKPPKSVNRESVPVVDPKTEPNFNIFTAYNPNYAQGTAQDGSKWIKAAVERHIADGGKRNVFVDTDDPKFVALRKVNKNPGTWQENLEFIKKRLDEYVELGGKLPSDNWPASVKREALMANSSSSSKKKDASAPALLARVVGLDTKEEKKKLLRKRKRDTDASSESEVYEYSERSAVSDPPANLAADAPPSPKKKRSSDTKGKTPVVTRTGRAVKPSRAAREAAEASSSSSSELSSLSSLNIPKMEESEESEESEFEYGVENIEEKIDQRKTD